MKGVVFFQRGGVSTLAQYNHCNTLTFQGMFVLSRLQATHTRNLQLTRNNTNSVIDSLTREDTELILFSSF